MCVICCSVQNIAVVVLKIIFAYIRSSFYYS